MKPMHSQGVTVNWYIWCPVHKDVHPIDQDCHLRTWTPDTPPDGDRLPDYKERATT